MTNYEIYELIAEELESRVDSGEITLEFAESVNDLAYDRWVAENAGGRYLEREAKKHGQYPIDYVIDRARKDKADIKAGKLDDDSSNRELYLLYNGLRSQSGHLSGACNSIAKNEKGIKRLKNRGFSAMTKGLGKMGKSMGSRLMD